MVLLKYTPVRFGRGHCRVGGDLEHGDDSLVGELDFGDEGLDGGFAFGGGAAGHDVGEVVADAGDGAGRRGRGLGAQVGGEFGAPVVGGGVVLGVGALDHGGEDGFGGGVEVE
ncbi:hypothetical protein [Micromonospora sp. NPDC005413]|uniref:hypothetical protein n=1 Tax=Micromonospora sp. NPDC005413 TaxID=3154563 RepID=UPI0033BD4E6C